MIKRMPEVKVSAAFLLLLLFLAVIDENNLIFYALSASALHECGHLAAMRWFEAEISQIKLSVFGAEIKLCRTESISYSEEIVIRACGPLAGILAALIFSPLGYLRGCETFFMLAGINLIFSAVNLIPVRNSDGGLIVYYACCRIFGPDAAEKTLKICTAVFGVLLIAAGTAIFAATKRNITLLTAGLFLTFGELCGKRKNFIKRQK